MYRRSSVRNSRTVVPFWSITPATGLGTADGPGCPEGRIDYDHDTV